MLLVCSCGVHRHGTYLKDFTKLHKNFIASSLLLRWLEIVSSTYILMGRYSHSLSLEARIMVSKNCPTIGEHIITC